MKFSLFKIEIAAIHFEGEPTLAAGNVSLPHLSSGRNCNVGLSALLRTRERIDVVRSLGQTPDRIRIDLRWSAGKRVGDRDAVADVGRSREVDPELVIEAASVDRLDQDLPVVRVGLIEEGGV